MNASTGTLTLPVSVKGMRVIDIDLNVSNLEMLVPDGAAVKIKTDANLQCVSIE